MTRLVRAQWQAKQEGALDWRIRRANLPERWTLETFPFARQPGVNRKQDSWLCGTGVYRQGGEHRVPLACGLLLKAPENGYRCQVTSTERYRVTLA